MIDDTKESLVSSKNEARHETQWDSDFRACVAALISIRSATEEHNLRNVGDIDEYEVLVNEAAGLADRMKAKREKQPAATPEPEIRKQYRSLVAAAEETREVFQRRDVQACSIPIALSRALGDLFDALEGKTTRWSK